MRIAVNTRLLLPGMLEGIGWFACETLRRITQWHTEHEFIFIFDRKYSQEFIFSENITPLVTHPQARHPLLWYLFFEWGIPPVMRRYKPDLFLSPDGWLSLSSPTPSLPVIHDLNFLHEPSWVSSLPRYYYNYFFPRFIKKAERIATVSEFTKNDIVSRFHVDPKKIDVVYNGFNKSYEPLSESTIQTIRNKYSGGLPYFLFISLVHPRKNLTRIIKAYDLFRKKTGNGVPFIVVGSTKYQTEDTRQAYEDSPYRQDIQFLGRLDHKELPAVMGASLCLIYASLFEGFGIPIIDAMRCNVPVITSNTTSMPEVGGEAVCYVDPYDITSISNAIQRIYTDEPYRKELIDKGRIQSEKFTWDKAAEKLWTSIEQIL